MSVQCCQYLIWGVKLPMSFADDWEKANPGEDFSTHFEKFMDDSAFEEKCTHYDGIFCLCDGMSSDWIFLGRVLRKAKDGELLGDPPICIRAAVPTMGQAKVFDAVRRHFGVQMDLLSADVGTWLVAQYR